MSDELKAIEALAQALGFNLIRVVDRLEVHHKAGTLDHSDGKYYTYRAWYECKPIYPEKELEED